MIVDDRLLARNNEMDDFDYEDEHVELESELGEYGTDDEDDEAEDSPEKSGQDKASEDDDDDDDE